MTMFFVFVLIIVSINPCTTFKTICGQIWEYLNIIYYHKSSYFGQTFCQKNGVINARVYWTNDITENSVTECSLKVHTFFDSICGKISVLKGFMDGLLKIKITKKRENTNYGWSAVFQQQQQQQRVRACLLVWYSWLYNISTILVWWKCNRQHRWLDIALTNMNTSTGPVQVYQICMFVGASLTDMTAG